MLAVMKTRTWVLNNGRIVAFKNSDRGLPLL